MQLKGSFFIGRRSFCGGFEKSEVMCFFVELDKGSPTIAVFPFMDSLNAAFIVFVDRLVASVLCVVCQSKFFPSKISGFSETMIYLVWRKFAGHNQPYNSVPEVIRSVYTDNPVSVGSLATGYFSFLTARCAIYFPAKFARSFVVSQQRSDVFGGQIRIDRFAHVIPFGGALS